MVGYSGIIGIIRRGSHALLIGVALFYLAFHLLHGDHGLIGHAIEKRKQAQLHAQLADVRAKRQALGHKIALLSGDAIDEDLLDELARRQIGVLGAHERLLVIE